MVRRVLGRILAVLALAAIGFGARVYSLTDRTNGKYEQLDLYSVSEGAYRTATDVAIEANLVAGHADVSPIGDYYLVGSQYLGESLEKLRLMMVLVSDPESVEGLNGLFKRFEEGNEKIHESDPVLLQGYITEMPSSAKLEMVRAFQSQGMGQLEAQNFFDENIMPLMFVEENTILGVTHGFAFIIIIGGIVMLVGSVVLQILAKNADKRDNSGGYIHPSERNRRGEVSYVPPVRRDTTSMGNTTSGAYGNTGSNQNNNGYRGYQSPGGNQSSGNRSYQSPNAVQNAELEVPFSPKMFKQPDYEEFFAPKRKKAEPEFQAIEAENAETEIEKIVRDKHPDPKAVINEVADMNKVDMEAEALPVKQPVEHPVVDLPDAPVASSAPRASNAPVASYAPDVSYAPDASDTSYSSDTSYTNNTSDDSDESYDPDMFYSPGSYRAPEKDEEIVPAAVELLDFDNAPAEKKSSFSGRADFWSKWELDDVNVRAEQELPMAKMAGLDELGAVDEISVSPQSFGGLREAPPEPEDVDYFTPTERIPAFDMDLDEYLKTDYLDPDRDD